MAPKKRSRAHNQFSSRFEAEAEVANVEAARPPPPLSGDGGGWPVPPAAAGGASSAPSPAQARVPTASQDATREALAIVVARAAAMDLGQPHAPPVAPALRDLARLGLRPCGWCRGREPGTLVSHVVDRNHIKSTSTLLNAAIAGDLDTNTIRFQPVMAYSQGGQYFVRPLQPTHGKATRYDLVAENVARDNESDTEIANFDQILAKLPEQLRDEIKESVRVLPCPLTSHRHSLTQTRRVGSLREPRGRQHGAERD